MTKLTQHSCFCYFGGGVGAKSHHDPVVLPHICSLGCSAWLEPLSHKPVVATDPGGATRLPDVAMVRVALGHQKINHLRPQWYHGNQHHTLGGGTTRCRQVAHTKAPTLQHHRHTNPVETILQAPHRMDTQTSKAAVQQWVHSGGWTRVVVVGMRYGGWERERGV